MSFTKNAWSMLLFTTFCWISVLSLTSVGLAQFDQGDIFAGQQEQQPVAPQTDATDQSSVMLGDGQIDPTQNNVEIEISENTRNQGFVGATAPGISSDSETGFIGAASDQSGPPLVDGASFGGGVNDVSPTIPRGANGQSNSFTVVRKSIRARLRPNFYAPATPNEVVSNRFQRHFSRQPGSQLSGSSYSVTVSDRTAYITGSVNTKADSDRLERQLRLEPGVYRIVNRLSVAQ